jgi:hypothetical protein
MAALDLTSFDAAMKEYYTSDKIMNMAYKNNPLLALVPKMTKFVGDTLPVPVIYSDTQGASATFATAQANKTASSSVKFALTRAKFYSLASIDNETIYASANKEGAFESAMAEIDRALNTATRQLAIALYGNGSGVLGRISTAEASVADTTITLSQIQDVVNFEKGMILKADSAAAGTSLRAGTVTLSGVNRSTGVLTASGNWNAGIGAVAAGDYLFREGDATAYLKGLQAWLDSSAAALFGVTRTVDATRLAGVHYTGTSDPIEEALINGMILLSREGGKPDYCFMSPNQYGNLIKALGSRVHYVDVKGPVGVGFGAIQIHGPTGAIKVLPDPNCPDGIAYLLEMDSWKLYSLGETPRIIMTDDNRVLRDTTADSIEVRTGYYAQLGCRAPGHNCAVTLATTTT